jgi:hypothetical protein
MAKVTKESAKEDRQDLANFASAKKKLKLTLPKIYKLQKIQSKNPGMTDDEAYRWLLGITDNEISVMDHLRAKLTEDEIKTFGKFVNLDQYE